MYQLWAQVTSKVVILHELVPVVIIISCWVWPGESQDAVAKQGSAERSKSPLNLLFSQSSSLR